MILSSKIYYMRCAELDWPSKLVEQRVAYVSQATIFCTRLAPGRASVGRPPKPNKWTHFTNQSFEPEIG